MLAKELPVFEHFDEHKFWNDPEYRCKKVGYKKTEKLKKYVDYNVGKERGGNFMSKICPETGEKVIYLQCQECEDKAACHK